MKNILVQQDIAQKQIVNILFYGHVGCEKEMIEKQLRCEREQRTVSINRWCSLTLNLSL